MSTIKIPWKIICVVCLREHNENNRMHSVHFMQDDHITILEKISICSNTDIKNWSIPEYICSRCHDELTVAYTFHMRCKVAFKVFKPTEKMNNELKLKGQKCIKIPPGLKIKKIKVDKIHITEENDYTNMGDTSMDESLPMAEYVPSEHHDGSLPMTENISSVHHDDENTNESGCVRSEDFIEDIVFDSPDLDENYYSVEYELINTDGLENVNLTDKSNDDNSLGSVEMGEEEAKKESDSEIPSEIETKNDGEKRVNGKRPPKICEICGNSYKYQHALDSHMRRHRNEKPFECEFCDKSFVANVELRRHMRVHTGQKPYSCNFCDRSFSDFGSRIKHERTHTGERPYKCKTCSKTFAYAHVLTVHNLTHTGEKKFKCPTCGKGFTKKAYLLSHEANKICDISKNLMYQDCNSDIKLFMQEMNTSSNDYDNLIIEDPIYENDTDDIISETFESLDCIM